MNIIKKLLLENLNTDEALLLKRVPEKNMVAVQSDLPGKEGGTETFKNKEILKKNNFKWNTDLSAWVTSDDNFKQAQSLLNSINKKEILINKLEDLEELILNSDAPNKNNLSDRIKVFVDDLANATDEAAADAKIKQYLTFFGRFRTYSFTNNILIFIQNPNATHVAGYDTWKTKFHRYVKKNAKSITIFAPVIKKSKNDLGNGNETEEQIVRHFRAVSVFDVADTEPIDERGEMPKEPKWFDDNTPNETADELFKYVEIVIQQLGIKLTNDQARGGEKGYSAGDHINLTSGIEGVGRLSTLIHELAHELMHRRKTSLFYDEANIENNPSSALKELQAESVSYTVLKHYEIPVQHHATYLALWKANKDKIKDNLNVIIKVSKFIIEEIDKVAKQFESVKQSNLQEEKIKKVVRERILKEFYFYLSKNNLIKIADELKNDIGEDLFIKELILNLDPEVLKKTLDSIAKKHSIELSDNPFDENNEDEQEQSYGSLWNTIKNYKS